MKNYFLQIVNYKINISELFYLLFLSLLFFAKGIGLYDGQTGFKIILIIACMCWLGKVITTSYTVREWVVIISLALLTAVTYLISGEKGPILYMMLITGSKNVSIRRIFGVGGIVWSVTFWGTVWVNAMHIVEPAMWGHERLGLGMVIRYGLGYSHPNVLAVSYLVFTMFIVYLLKEKYDFRWFLGLMAGNAFVFLYSLGNTGLLVTTLFLLLMLYWNYRQKLAKVEKILIQLVFPACLSVSILAPLMLKGSLFELFNKILNTRLVLAQYFLTLQPIKPLGTRVADIITNKLTMDNSYVNLLVTHGYVTTLIVTIGYLYLIYKLCKEEKGTELCIIIVCLIAGMVEPFLFNTSFKNLSLVFMGSIIWSEGEGKPLLSLKHMEWTFSANRLRLVSHQIRQQLYKERKKLLVFTLILMIAGGITYHYYADIPERLIIPHSCCDQVPGAEIVYLDNSAGERNGDLVIGYVDPETRMNVLSPNAVILEHIRGIAIVSLSGGLIGLLLGSIVVIISLRGKQKTCQRH